jgi:hypothetical protein
MIRPVALEQPRVRQVLRQIATVCRPDERVTAVLDDERRNVDERQDLADVEVEDRTHLRERRPGRRREALDASVPLLDPGLRRVAADINAIWTPWPCATIVARSEPAASITAQTSSIHSSGATACSTTRSDSPTPRMSNQMTRA